MPRRSTLPHREHGASPRRGRGIDDEGGGPSARVLRLQRTVGNQATRQLLETRPGGRLPLTSPRFAGDPLLEACHQDKARLGVGARGEPVRKIQRALIDLGFDLGKAGADGVYGQATATAVRQFKAKEKLRRRA